MSGIKEIKDIGYAYVNEIKVDSENEIVISILLIRSGKKMNATNTERGQDKAIFEELVNTILEELEKDEVELKELDFNHTFTGKNKLEVNVRLVLED